MHQLILPTEDCRRLKHPTQWRNKVPGPGQYEFCQVCTLGYEMALAATDDEDMADDFVKALRREPTGTPIGDPERWAPQ